LLWEPSARYMYPCFWDSIAAVHSESGGLLPSMRGMLLFSLTKMFFEKNGEHDDDDVVARITRRDSLNPDPPPNSSSERRP